MNLALAESSACQRVVCVCVFRDPNFCQTVSSCKIVIFVLFCFECSLAYRFYKLKTTVAMRKLVYGGFFHGR